MKTLMEKEIFEQPTAILACEKENAAKLAEIAKLVKTRNIRNIIMAARGSSDHACNYFKYLCEVYAGIPVSFAAPSVITLYNGKLDMSNTLVVGVSQSGKAADVLAVLEKAKAQGALTVTVTNYTTSPMATAGDFHLYLNVGEELSVAATKTLSAQFYVLARLASEIADSDELRNDLKEVSPAIEKVLEKADELAALSTHFVNAIDCYTLGRGFTYALAQEAALKVQETTYVKGKAYAVSDFHHGPFAVMDEKTNAFLFIPSGKDEKDCEEMLEKLIPTGVTTVVYSNVEKYVKRANYGVLMPDVAEAVAPIVYVVAAQLFACNLSQKRGLNPDSPRGLKKITITK